MSQSAPWSFHNGFKRCEQLQSPEHNPAEKLSSCTRAVHLQRSHYFVQVGHECIRVRVGQELEQTFGTNPRGLCMSGNHISSVDEGFISWFEVVDKTAAIVKSLAAVTKIATTVSLSLDDTFQAHDRTVCDLLWFR